jgi:hypothetical protein
VLRGTRQPFATVWAALRTRLQVGSGLDYKQRPLRDGFQYQMLPAGVPPTPSAHETATPRRLRRQRLHRDPLGGDEEASFDKKPHWKWYRYPPILGVRQRVRRRGSLKELTPTMQDFFNPWMHPLLTPLTAVAIVTLLMEWSGRAPLAPE